MTATNILILPTEKQYLLYSFLWFHMKQKSNNLSHLGIQNEP